MKLRRIKNKHSKINKHLNLKIMITNTKTSSNFLILVLCTVLLFTMQSFDIFAVVDTNYPIIVERKINVDRYRCTYIYNSQKFFMEVITKDSLIVGDTLRFSK